MIFKYLIGDIDLILINKNFRFLMIDFLKQYHINIIINN